MPDEPRPHDEPATPPEPDPGPEPTRELPAEAATPAAGPVTPEPAKPGKAAQFFGHRATQLVGAGLAGLLIGGGIAIAFLADDDRDDHPFQTIMRGDDGDRPEFRDMPWRHGGPDQHMKQREFREKVLPRLREWIPEHHHDEDGNVVPGEPTK